MTRAHSMPCLYNSGVGNVLTSAPTVIPATSQHIDDALEWLHVRGMAELPRDVFSSTGYVVPGVAAVWLYLTDSSLAFLEMLISNPAAPKRERRIALDAVVARAVDEAARAGTRVLNAFVQRPDVQALGLRHQLKPVGTVTMLSANLSKEVTR